MRMLLLALQPRLLSMTIAVVASIALLAVTIVNPEWQGYLAVPLAIC